MARQRPRLLLVPAFTELQWTIKAQLEEWAQVASYDPPGVGSEPPPAGLEPEHPGLLREWRRAAAERGLAEVDRLGWESFFLVADGEGVATAVLIAEARLCAVQGLALGHAALSRSTHGERPAINREVWSAMGALLRTDRQAFIRHGIAQVTSGSVTEEHAAMMVERFPNSDLAVLLWDALGMEREPIGDRIDTLELPLLLGQHVGCLGSTDEGYRDIVARFPEAATASCPEACTVSPTFAEALRGFCTG